MATLAELIKCYNTLVSCVDKEIEVVQRKSFKNKADAESHIEALESKILLLKIDRSAPDTSFDQVALYSEVKDLEDRAKWPTQDDLKPRRNDIAVQAAGTICSLSTAKSKGFVMYWNGSPCTYNHYSPRYVLDGKCKKCYKEYQQGLRIASEVCKEKL
jgi:hypothetical protein